MQDSNKVVIKINYQGNDKQTALNTESGIVTEWHYKRIFSVVLFVVSVVILLFYILNKQPVEKVYIKESKETKGFVTEKRIKPTKLIINTNKPDTNIKELQLDEKYNVKIPVKVLNNKVVRAVITTGLNNKEPIDTVQTALTVTTEKAVGVYYFTEIVGMKGRVLYHHWFKGDKLIYKRRINILGNRWRASTSKLIPFSKAGMWRVRLVDKKGVILNDIQFKIITG